jgi:hypothetical protein
VGQSQIKVVYLIETWAQTLWKSELSIPVFSWKTYINIQVSDVTNWVDIFKIWNSNPAIGFLVQKTYPCQFLDQNSYLIMFYCVLGEFWAILGIIGGQWRHKGGQEF